MGLIGGTGGMGVFIREELLARGHDVVAIVRRPDAIVPNERLRVVVADVYDTDRLCSALAGVDVVVSAFNPGWHTSDLYDNYLRGARSIQAATKSAGVERLLVLGGASSLYSADGRQLIESGLPPDPYASGVRAARDYHEEIQAEKDLDWVYLSPPMECGPIGPDGRTGTYRVGTDHPVVDAAGRNALSRQDLAVAVVDEIERPKYHRARFTVGY